VGACDDPRMHPKQLKDKPKNAVPDTQGCV
jgi:hypothetical protein